MIDWLIQWASLLFACCILLFFSYSLTLSLTTAIYVYLISRNDFTYIRNEIATEYYETVTISWSLEQCSLYLSDSVQQLLPSNRPISIVEFPPEKWQSLTHSLTQPDSQQFPQCTTHSTKALKKNSTILRQPHRNWGRISGIAASIIFVAHSVDPVD